MMVDGAELQREDTENKYVKARVEGTGIFCGDCGHKIGSIRNGNIYLLCKHKNQGKKCFHVNKLSLQDNKTP